MLLQDNSRYSKEKIKNIVGFVWDLVKVICISLAIIIPVRYFLIQPFYVKGASMEPNFYDHEYLIIDEISYRFHSPARGDIVVFKYPKDPSQYFIKRIIGLPGETVEIKGNQIYIYQGNKKYLLDETSYLSPLARMQGEYKWTLGPTEYYVLGDNRQYSLDSRIFGPIDRSLIIGRTWVRGWPLDKITVFDKVQYNF